MHTYSTVQPYIGTHVECHTQYGTFHGVVVHCSKQYIILGPTRESFTTVHDYYDPARGFFGPPPPPLGPPGVPPGPMGPLGPGGPGGGWHVAIPLAAILGITAIGLHWW